MVFSLVNIIKTFTDAEKLAVTFLALLLVNKAVWTF